MSLIKYNNYYYVESKNIKVFPCSYRGQYGDQTPKVFDPEARLNTEYNFINSGSLSTAHKSYIVSWDNNILKCVVGGYYFEIANCTPNDFLVNDTPLNLYITLATIPLTESGTEVADPGRKTYILSSVEPITDNYLDIDDGSDPNHTIFLGLIIANDLQVNDGALSVIKKTNNGAIVDTSKYLPVIYSGTGHNSIIMGDATINEANADYAHAEGVNTKANGNGSHAEGQGTTTTTTGGQSHAEGYGTTTSGNVSHAEGTSTHAAGVASHAEGSNTNTNGSASHAEGYGTVTGNNEEATKGNYAHAEGNETKAFGDYSHAEGAGVYTYGEASHAEGNATEANGFTSHTEGKETIAYGEASHTEGYKTVTGDSKDSTKGMYAHAEGNKTNALGNYSHAEGNGGAAWLSNFKITEVSDSTTYITDINHTNLKIGRVLCYNNKYVYITAIPTTKSFTTNAPLDTPETIIGEKVYVILGTAFGQSSHVEGSNTTANGISTHAEGFNSFAIGNYSHTEGYGTTASGVQAHAEGYETEAGANAHSEGKYTKAAGDGSHAEGNNTEANGTGAHAEGHFTVTHIDYAHAEGENTNAYGKASHAEGFNTDTGDNLDSTKGSYSHAEGNATITNGRYSHAEGSETEANGTASHAEGQGTSANGDYSHAEGNGANAYGNHSHAEGNSTTGDENDTTHTKGTGAHAEGYATQATGNYSHSEGNLTKATGDYAHAEGQGTEARKRGSHAGGLNTIATAEYQTVVGKYNEEKDDALFIVGCGDVPTTGGDADRRNALTVYTDGTTEGNFRNIRSGNGEVEPTSTNATGLKYSAAEKFEDASTWSPVDIKDSKYIYSYFQINNNLILNVSFERATPGNISGGGDVWLLLPLPAIMDVIFNTPNVIFNISNISVNGISVTANKWNTDGKATLAGFTPGIFAGTAQTMNASWSSTSAKNDIIIGIDSDPANFRGASVTAYITLN